jgi:DNA repair exonuclease SbcCD nuclease subunit
MLYFSDLHSHISHPVMGSDFINLSVNALKQIRAFAVKSRDKVVVHGGDWTHLKDRIYTKVWNAISKELTEWEKEGIFSYWVMGNHDFDSDVSLEVFGSFPNVTVITHPQIIKIQNINSIFLPYGSTKLHLDELINKISKTSDEKVVVFLHDYFKGITNYHGNVIATNGWELPDIPADFAFAGHSHKYQEILRGRFYHVGSPYQVSFNEVGQKKYFIQFDGTKVVKHEFSFPKFLVLNVGDDYEPLECKNSYIKLKYSVGDVTLKDIQEIKKRLLEEGAIKVKAEAIVVKREKTERMEVTKETTHEDYIKNYVKTIPTTLDKALLVQLGKELMGGI